MVASIPDAPAEAGMPGALARVSTDVEVWVGGAGARAIAVGSSAGGDKSVGGSTATNTADRVGRLVGVGRVAESLAAVGAGFFGGGFLPPLRRVWSLCLSCCCSFVGDAWIWFCLLRSQVSFHDVLPWACRQKICQLIHALGEARTCVHIQTNMCVCVFAHMHANVCTCAKCMCMHKQVCAHPVDRVKPITDNRILLSVIGKL